MTLALSTNPAIAVRMSIHRKLTSEASSQNHPEIIPLHSISTKHSMMKFKRSISSLYPRWVLRRIHSRRNNSYRIWNWTICIYWILSNQSHFSLNILHSKHSILLRSLILTLQMYWRWVFQQTANSLKLIINHLDWDHCKNKKCKYPFKVIREALKKVL